MTRELYFTVHKNELSSVAFLQLARHPDDLHFTMIWGWSFENIKPQYTTRSLLNLHLAVLKTTFFPWLFLRRASKFLTYSFMSRLCTIMSSLIVEHPTQVLRQMLSGGPLGYFSRWSRSVIKPLLRYKPMCVEKVVVFRELSFNSPWWCPFDMSKWKNTVETPRSFKTTSMVGCWISLRGMVWFANSHIRVQSHLALILKFFGGWQRVVIPSLSAGALF